MRADRDIISLVPRRAVLIGALALLGCARDLGPVAKKALPPGAEEFARNSIALLGRGDWAAVGEMLTSEARTPDTPAQLAALGRELAGSLTDSLALAGLQFTSTLMGSGEWRHWASLSYQVPLLDATSGSRRYVLATVEIPLASCGWFGCSLTGWRDRSSVSTRSRYGGSRYFTT